MPITLTNCKRVTLEMLTDSNPEAFSGADSPLFCPRSGCYAGLNKNVTHGITC